MTKKRRVKLMLEEDEAAVFAPVEFWEHLREVYFAYAEHANSTEDRTSWENAAELVSYWVGETQVTRYDEDY